MHDPSDPSDPNDPHDAKRGGQPKEEKVQDPNAGLSQIARAYRDAAPYLEIGWMFVVSVGGCLWLGAWLDRKFVTPGRWIVVGGVLGIAIGFLHFFKVVLQLNRRKKP